MTLDPNRPIDDPEGDTEEPYDEDFIWDEDMPSWGGF
jgi:hypothetical protein